MIHVITLLKIDVDNNKGKKTHLRFHRRYKYEKLLISVIEL